MGLASSFTALFVGLIGGAQLLSGAWFLLGCYLLLTLAGALFYGTALSRISSSPDPEAFAKDRKAARVGILLALVPVVVVVSLGLMFAMFPK
ncbi:hypothetical protein GCM10023183_27610 [Nibribacter koreensis]|uniref:Uncharacterized protein n=1 Tax=Nibribacter koreensis TaxID=1084519 RepID=A0ABP8FSC8_9BACT